MQKKILAIDARPLSRGTGGIQRYITELLPTIIKTGKFEIILYSDQKINTRYKKEHSEIIIKDLNTKKTNLLTWFVAVSLWAKNDQPDIFWSPRHHLPIWLPKKTIKFVTIHDFVWKTAPKTMPLLQRLSEKILMPRSINLADKLICISATTHNQLAEFYPNAKLKSSVILHGYGTDIKNDKAPSNGNDKYFIAVGTLEPRKNYERLLIAFDLYVQQGGQNDLIIVGRNGWNYKPIYKQFTRTESNKRIRILTDADDKTLNALYQNATGFISCSIDEGYGLPPQEASMYGLPLLLADIAVYRELYQHANVWIDPLSVDDLAKGLLILDKQPKCTEKKPSSIKSWTQCANEHVELFV